MKKIRKGKKMLLIFLAVVIIVIAIVIIANVVDKPQETPDVPETPVIVQLPETTYSDMEVRNIVMELLKGNAQDGGDQTLVTFEICNTTDSKVEAQSYEAVLIGADESIIAKMPYNPVKELEVGEVQRVNVVYSGDLTATTQIKLIKE